MIPDPVQTPLEVIATLLALFLGQKGYGFVKQKFFSETNQRLNDLEARVSQLENPPVILPKN
jgi:hypothetical protein